MIDKRHAGDKMIVIQNQDEMFIDLSIDLICDGNEQPFFILFNGGHTLKGCQRIATEMGEPFSDRSNQISEKPLRFLIQRIQRKPADREFTLLCQIDQEGGFSISSGGYDKKQSLFQLVIQGID